MTADRNGKISFSRVIFLPHNENSIVRKYDRIELASGLVVEMTRNHLLPDCGGALLTARSLKEGVRHRGGQRGRARARQGARGWELEGRDGGR